MFLELITIIFVILLAAMLCWSDKNSKHCMFSHILVGLSGIVFYKLANTYKLSSLLKSNKEHFYDLQDINNFIENANGSVISDKEAQSLSASQLSEYTQKIDTLINALRDYTNAVNYPSSNTSVSSDNLQQLSLESQQQYQMFQIDYLKKQLQNMKNIINTSAINNTSTNYKPIKIYSSCVVSNADGTTVSNIPVNQRQTSTSKNPLQQSLNAIRTTALQSNTETAVPSLMADTTPVSLSPETGFLGGIIRSLSNASVSVQ